MHAMHSLDRQAEARRATRLGAWGSSLFALFEWGLIYFHFMRGTALIFFGVRLRSFFSCILFSLD